MKLKTYVARNPQEALAQVRRDLGAEAFILATQSRLLAGPGSGGGPRRRVEVTAALNPECHPSNPARVGARPFWQEPSGLTLEHLQEDLAEIKAYFRQWLKDSGPPAWLARHPDLKALYQAFIRAEIGSPLLPHWLEKIHPLIENQPEGGADLKKQAWEHFLRMIRLVDPWKSATACPIRWSFLGTTGVGKSTTLAKLAVRVAFMKKKRVGMISLCPGKLAAMDPLASFARIAGLPFLSVENRQKLTEAFNRWADLEVILVDTPGLNPRDPQISHRLLELLGEIPGLAHHLVLSSATGEVTLEATITAFRVLPLATAIVTKIDETSACGNVLNQLYKHQLPLSYLSVGSRVPEDLKLATRANLTGILLSSGNGRVTAKG